MAVWCGIVLIVVEVKLVGKFLGLLSWHELLGILVWIGHLAASFDVKVLLGASVPVC